jgi:ABC-type uncharacterized transport system permease subunit
MEFVSFFESLIRISLPLLFASMGGYLGEKTGVTQIGLEAYLLFGAFAGVAATLFTGSSTLGFFIGGLAGAFVASIFAYLVVYRHAQSVVTGMAFNLLSFGAIPSLTLVLFGTSGSTPSIDSSLQLHWLPIFALLLIAITIIWLERFTLAGLILRVTGENREVTHQFQLPVQKIQFLSVVMAGFITALGGASLSLMLSLQYSPLMSAGRGFIALAAIILGGWKAPRILMMAVLLALFEVLQVQLQTLNLGIPLIALQLLPYFITILVLVVFVKNIRAPRDLK